MIRVILFVILIAALGLGFGWLADRPGDLVFTFAGQRHQLTMMVAASIVVAVIAAVMLVWWLIKHSVRSPYALQRHFRARKRDRGYQSLSTGLIAAGAGDLESARRLRKQADKLLRADQEPLLRLLDMQTALLEGRKDEVRRHLEAMIADPETKLLGLRGLYLQASREGAREAAFHYAEQANSVAPQLEWASDAVIGHKVLQGDIREGLRVLEARKSTIPFGGDGKAAREELKRDRAALLTAKAMAVFDSDPEGAKAAAQEALKLQPELIPAVIIAARCLLRDGSIRKANRLLEAAWKREPHPEIAQTYIHGRSGDTALDRLKKAKALAGLRHNHAQCCLIVAQAALGAGELALARENAESALKLEPRESAYLLMADIEEAQTGEQGRVREWLARALKAPRDPAWTADGVVSAQWAPVSPVTGKLNAFEWKVPLAEITGEAAPVMEADIIPQESIHIDHKLIVQKASGSEAAHKSTAPVETEIADAEIIGQQAGAQAKPSGGAAASAYQAVSKPDEDMDTTAQHRLIVDDPGVKVPKDSKQSESHFRLF